MHRLPDRLAVEVWPLDIVGPKLGPMRFATLRHPRSIAGAGAFAAAVVVALAAAVAGIGMLVGAFGPSPATPIAPAVTARLGASIPTSRLASFSWAPDGALLFVVDSGGGRVFDAEGRQLATFPAAEGWLDATHLVGWDGVVSDARQSRSGTSPADVRVIANGHGAAAVVTGSATCAADPQVRWYRNGHLDATTEQANPLAWSPDGANVLVGHASCGGASAWQGDVQVVDFGAGKVEATLPNVTGEIGFGVEPDAIAGQTGSSVEILDEGATSPITLDGVRFLGWLDVETIFVERDGQILVADLDPPNIPDARTYQRWQAAGPRGTNLAADADGNATGILGEDGSMLLDLSGAGLTAGTLASTGATLQPRWWAPDGRRLVIPAANGASLRLISIEGAAPTAS